MAFTKRFTELMKEDVLEAGGKGASLGEMTQAGIPVPGGFVVLASSFDAFLVEAKLEAEVQAALDLVNIEAIHTVDEASRRIQALIEVSEMPANIAAEILANVAELDAPYMAVRSSATSEDSADAAWAGQLDSYLNTPPEQVLKKVQECWASLFTPRAIFYRFEKGLHTSHISVAVVVQKMVNSEVSGIAFSVHPVTQDRNQMIIEAGLGLGEAIVSGQVTPDSYVISKAPRNIINTQINHQSRRLIRVTGGGNEWVETGAAGQEQFLSPEQVLALAEIVIGIENHYGFPCDIEWAYEGGTFYIVQSRPITTLSVRTTDQAALALSPTDFKYYGFWKQKLLTNSYWAYSFNQNIADKMGVELDSPGSLIGTEGHVMVDLTTLHDMREQLARKIVSHDITFFDNLRKVTKETCDAAQSACKTLVNSDISAVSFNRIDQALNDVNFIWLLAAGYFVVEAEEQLQKIVVEKKVPAAEIFQLIPPFTTMLSEQQEEVKQLRNLAKDLSEVQIRENPTLKKMLAEHTHKFAWIETANFIGEPFSEDSLIELLMNKPKEGHRDSSPSYLPDEELKFYFAVMSICGYIKQICAETFSKISYEIRPYFLRLAQEMNIPYIELINLSRGEIKDYLSKKLSPGEISELLLRRKNTDYLLYRTATENIILEDNGNVATFLKQIVPIADLNSNEIHGITGNPGVVSGPVCVVLNSDDFSKFKAGDILVSTMTTPDFVVLMQKSAAIVTDIGGLLCHASIVSRELNKACVIGTRVATSVLKDGDVVEVDATAGIVRKLQPPPNTDTLADHFLSLVGDQELFKAEAAFIPLLVTTNWFVYYDEKLEIQYLYPVFVSIKNGLTAMYWGHNAYRGVSKRIFKEYIQGTLNVDEIERDRQELEKQAEILYKKFIETPERTEAFLMNMLRTAREYIRRHNARTLFLDVVEQRGISEVLAELGESIDLEAVWTASQISDFLSFDTKNKEAILTLRHADPAYLQYVFAGYSHIPTFDEVTKEVAALSDDELRAEIAQKQAEALEGQKQKVVAIKELSLTAQKTLAFIDWTSQLRDERKLFFNRCDVVIFRAVSELYVLWGVDEALVPVSMGQEVLRGRKYIAAQEPALRARLANTGLLLVSDDAFEEQANFPASDLARIDAAHDRHHESEHGDIILGETASVGMAQGRVRVVFEKDDFATFIEGEVLVTGMTRPEFVPLMKKAVAIVTDEGGITSHAAIVSRELGKPCIIGTGIASRKLKTGDLVEVDANNGQVRVLKRAD